MKKKSKILLILFLCLIIGASGGLAMFCQSITNRRFLSNENATDEAKKLYEYIASVSGKGVISGQQESTWRGSEDYEFEYIFDATGKYPAIRGFDFMDDDFDGVVERAKKWAQKGGIVSICWHCSSNFDKAYNECKDDELTAEQWEKIFTYGTEENKAFLSGMDKAGKALSELQQAGIPVLWRPFHEFDGGWFWWGKGGSENFKKLWIMMYDRFTNDLKLNNLIWVLGYSHNGNLYKGKPEKWYVGADYCDIVGADSYEVDVNGAEKRLYDIVKVVARFRKPFAMHETGLIPTVEQFKEVPWVWFLTWHTEYLTDNNSKEHLNEIYNSDYVITLDELPKI